MTLKATTRKYLKIRVFFQQRDFAWNMFLSFGTVILFCIILICCEVNIIFYDIYLLKVLKTMPKRYDAVLCFFEVETI